MFVVNLKGRPFMGGLTENRPLLYSLAATFALVFMSARYAAIHATHSFTDCYCCTALRTIKLVLI